MRKDQAQREDKIKLGMGENLKNINWYPGHMTKAMRMMKEDIRLIDLIIELVDARAPLSSRNPDIDELGKNKSRVVLLNKADLADPGMNRKWTEYFGQHGIRVLELDSRSSAGTKGVLEIVKEACREKIERDKKRGIVNRPVRAMVCGIPNVGKSTFINSFAGRAAAKTGNKPGVTRGKQWIRIRKELELLDTPGVLWPKFEDRQVGIHLALLGSINDEIIVMEELSLELVGILKKYYPDALKKRYEIDPEKADADLLNEIAVSRKCFLKGEIPDLSRAARLLIDDFRSGRLGRITLEHF